MALQKRQGPETRAKGQHRQGHTTDEGGYTQKDVNIIDTHGSGEGPGTI